MFGGNVTDQTFIDYKAKFGDDLGKGLSMLNFNDMFYGLNTLILIWLGGWQNDVDKLQMFQNPAKYNKITYPFFWFLFHFFTSTIVMNIIQTFFIDSICGTMSRFESDIND